MKTLHRHISIIVLLCLCHIGHAKQRFLPEHPRLLFTLHEEARIKRLIEKDAFANELAYFFRNEADSIVALQQIKYKKVEMGETSHILNISREYLYRLGTLSLAYRLYQDTKYLEAANKAILWVCKFPDWNPPHYLDTAEMATAVAIAYDWLFHSLPDSTKSLAKECLYDRAISLAINEYETGKSGSWAKRETNWNVVCNAGMTMAALAVAEDYPDENSIILDNVAHYMPNCLKHFAPDGVCYEGPNYWSYTTTYLSIYLKAVADNDNNRGGIVKMPGIKETALYQKRTLSPNGRVFNFGNAANEKPSTPAFFLFSNIFNIPEVASWNIKELSHLIRNSKRTNQMFFLELPWINLTESQRDKKLPKLDIYRNEINDIIVFNGNRTKKGAIYMIAKGGQPQKAHQQLDCGTFLIESDGICWTEDIGHDSYSLPGFWDYTPKGKRWDYFRNTNMAHNTINIDHKNQHSGGKAYIIKHKTSKSKPFVTLDLTSLYKDQATNVTRTFTLKNDYTMETKDCIELSNPQSTAYWRAITHAKVEINKNRLHLEKDGKHFYMKITSPQDATFVSFPATPNTDAERPITNTSIIETGCKFSQGKGEIIIQMSSKEL